MDKYFTREHEWIELLSDTKARIGITDYAQTQLGDLVYVELPAIGKTLASGDQFAVVESVKAASEVYAPVDGEVASINTDLHDDPGLINKAAEGAGWIAEVTLSNPNQLKALMSETDYQRFIRA